MNDLEYFEHFISSKKYMKKIDIYANCKYIEYQISAAPLALVVGLLGGRRVNFGVRGGRQASPSVHFSGKRECGKKCK
jgi:hypothetical protein